MASSDEAMQASDSSDDKTAVEEGGSMTSYFRIFRYNDTAGWIMTAVSVICMMATGVLLPLMNLIFGQFVNVFNDFLTGRKTPEEFRSSLDHYTLYFVYLFVAKFVLSYIWTTLTAINAIRTTRRLRMSFLEHTLRQEIQFFDGNSGKGNTLSGGTGAIATAITSGANLAHQGIAEKFGLAVQATTTFIAAFVVAFCAQWKLTLITICVVPAILLVVSVAVTFDMRCENQIMALHGRAHSLAEDVLGSIRNVHAFWAFPAMEKMYNDLLAEARAIGMRKKPPLHAVLFSVQFFCIYAAYGLAFWQGVQMYHRGEITEPGKIVTVIFAVLLAVQGLTQIFPQIMAVSKAAAAASNLFRTIDRPSRIDSLSEEGVVPQTCHGHIALNRVGFTYPSRPGVPVLGQLDLDIPANKTTAIVGPSGSGKSTVVGLLERWFSPNEGSITLDGHRIEDLNIRWLRTNIRLVQQEPILFSGTIFENVANGLAGTAQEDASDATKMKLVEAACEAAYAHEFIKRLPEGYHTHIGERGNQLSGGQKQRLVIARSIISNPRILLLDEATSALDPQAELAVQKALHAASHGRTVLVIAHRLSTIREADNIVVMARGSIVEQGTHGDLMAQDGAYARLVHAQDLGPDSRSEGNVEPSDKNTNKPAEKSPDNIPIAHEKEPCEDKKTDYSLLQCLAMIIREEKELRLPFAFLASAAIIAGGVYPAFALLFSRAVTTFALSDDALVYQGNRYALYFFVMALANLVTYMVLGWASAVLSQIVGHRYGRDLFRSLLRQRIRFFDDTDSATGALVAHLASEPAALQELLSSNIALMLTMLASLVSSCVLAIVIGWRLGLALVLGALPPLIAAGYARIRLERRLDDETATRFSHSAALATEAVRAIRTVASLSLERTVLARYSARLRQSTSLSSSSSSSAPSSTVRLLAVTMIWYSLSQSVSFLAMALGFWYGGRLLSFGQYTAIQFYTVFIAAIFSGEGAASFFIYTTSITQAQRAANYILTLRQQIPEELRCDAHDDGMLVSREDEQKRVGLSVEFKDVSFAYPCDPERSVLRHLSLAARPGQFIALVGASGCGKSTVISLLERFYDPTSGVILLDGRDLESRPLQQFRSKMALVQQEPVLYQGSVRDNILLGRGVLDSVGTSDEAADADADAVVMEACRLANIDAFVSSLPEGLGTLCGSQGLQMSGGQRQRIALARALIRQPRLLLLDEATSSLDSESERLVQAALVSSAAGPRTTIAVAHRLSTIKNADIIFVLAGGLIEEAGSHDELVARRGAYYRMCLGQSLDQ